MGKGPSSASNKLVFGGPILGPRRTSPGVNPRTSHPRHPSDTAPKGSRNPLRGRSPFRGHRSKAVLLYIPCGGAENPPSGKNKLKGTQGAGRCGYLIVK